MHVRAKDIAFLGILLAIAVILVYAGTIMETSTLFFISAASCCMGISIVQYGKRLGAGFLIACTLLTLILLPNKMYCLTLATMNLYIFLAECLMDKFPKTFRFIKYIIFNAVFIPVLLLIPEFLYAGKISPAAFIWLFAGAQVVFTIYDYAYRRIIYGFWPEFWKKINRGM